MLAGGPEKKAKGVSETPEAKNAKERAFHKSVIRDIEDAKNESTCLKIIEKAKEALQKIKTKKGFESLYNEYIGQLNKAERLVKKYSWTGANKNDKYKKQLRDRIDNAIGKYARRINTLFPEKKAQTAETSPEKTGKPPVSPESPEKITLKSARENLNKLKKHVNKIKADIEKRLGVPGEKLNDIINRLNTIEGRINELVEKPEKQTQEVIKKINERILKLAKQLPAYERAKPEKKAEKAPESIEGITTLSNKLGKLLDRHLKSPDKTSFMKIKGQINNILDSIAKKMNVDVNNLQTDKYIDIPGGYKLALIKWPKNPKYKPNFLVYDGADLICFRHPRQGLKKAEYNATPDKARSRAEIAKSLSVLGETYSIKPATSKNPRGGLRIKNKYDFVNSMIDLGNHSQNAMWEVNMPDYHLKFNRGVITVQPNKAPFKIRFFAGAPETIQFVYPGKGVATDKIDNYVFEETEKEKKSKQSPEDVKKKAEEAKKKSQERIRAKLKAERQKEIAEKSSDMNKMLNPKFKDIVKFKKDNPYEFKIDAEGKKHINLVRNTKIHELLDLSIIKDRPLRIKIQGEKGVRYGLYYPGQRTFYETKGENGKQTGERIKFYNNDTITLKKVDEKESYLKLNNDRENIKEPGQIEAYRNFNALKEKYNEFKKLKLDKQDVDLKPLQKYKKVFAFYKPERIFTGEAGKNWTQENIKKAGGYKKVNEILKTEISVLQKAIDIHNNPYNEGVD
jgi:hypothetical protein